MLFWGIYRRVRKISMLTVYHLGVSQSERIVWLCEELEIPYDLVRFDRDPVTRLAPAAYKALHPTGMAPVIKDGDVVLAESCAIIDYIIHRHGDGRLAVGPESDAYPDYLFWFNYANGTVMPMEMIGMILNGIGYDGSHGVLDNLMKRLPIAYDLLEAKLGQAPYLAGDDFTAADIIMLFPLTTMRVFFPKDLSPYPNILRYLARIGDRPGYQRAMAKADPEMQPLLAASNRPSSII